MSNNFSKSALILPNSSDDSSDESFSVFDSVFGVVVVGTNVVGSGFDTGVIVGTGVVVKRFTRRSELRGIRAEKVALNQKKESILSIYIL